MRTGDVDEAQRLFQGLYADAVVEAHHPTSFQWEMDLVPCGPVQLTMGRLKTATRVVAPRGTERYVLSMANAATTEVAVAGRPCTVARGRSGVMYTPGLPATLRVAAGFQGRNVVIEPAALETHLRALTGQDPTGPIAFDPAVNFDTGPGAVVGAIAQLLAHEAERTGASPHMVAALRETLLTGLLTGLKHSASALFAPAPARVGPGCVKRAVEYIEAHLTEPITAADIAAAVGVPGRSLRASFAARHGVAPMQYLKQRRFELARRRLLEAAPGTTVASVVAALGLGDAGRFSVAFRKRFGQSPSALLASGRSASDRVARGPR